MIYKVWFSNLPVVFQLEVCLVCRNLYSNKELPLQCSTMQVYTAKCSLKGLFKKYYFDCHLKFREIEAGKPSKKTERNHVSVAKSIYIDFLESQGSFMLYLYICVCVYRSIR